MKNYLNMPQIVDLSDSNNNDKTSISSEPIVSIFQILYFLALCSMSLWCIVYFITKDHEMIIQADDVRQACFTHPQRS